MIDRIINLYRRLGTYTKNIIVSILALMIALSTIHTLIFPATAMSRNAGEEEPGVVLGTEENQESFDSTPEGEDDSTAVTEGTPSETDPAVLPEESGIPADDTNVNNTEPETMDLEVLPVEPVTGNEEEPGAEPDPAEVTEVTETPQEPAEPEITPETKEEALTENTPEPTETPEPTSTPEVTPTPEATAETTPTPDATPTPAPEATPTPTPEVTPTPTPEAEEEEEEEEESDPEADVEDAQDWEEMFRDIELTGVWADDLVTLAETQIGYTESETNFVRDDEDNKHGYTRYGAFNSDPYGKWDAHFVMFNLYYAGITEMDFPYQADCEEWVNALKDAEMFFESGAYVPSKGDLVFADTDEDGSADHVAIVKAVEFDSENHPDKLVIIEGDVDNKVKENTYEFYNPLIVGFGKLPENPALVQEESAPQILTFEGSTKKVDVTVKYEEGAFPAGTTMKVKDIFDKPVIDAIHDTVNEENKEIVGVQAVDITFYDPEGNEIEPVRPIQVTMKSRAVPEEVTEKPVVVHVDNEMNTEVVESATPQEEPVGSTEAVTFEAGSFSVYAIVYTVDFHYEVNGKQYDFSLPGGGYVSLTELFEQLGISYDETSEGTADSKTIRINDIAQVTFSDPELMWVKKIEEDTTVGELLKRYALKPEFSEDLTENEIQTIKDNSVKSGDWALISLRPFESEETLTVTMKNGDVFTISVTDGQIRTRILSADGETWEITVTFDDKAGIPDDAELRVEELQEDNEGYQDIQRKIRERMDEDIPASPVLFDISLWSNNQEIEPAEGSEVLVTIKLIGDAATGMYSGNEAPILINDLPADETQAEIDKQMQVLHLTKDETIDVMETEDVISEREAMSTFRTPSFSNWLLYLDEDLTSIDVTSGDSITLRPYSEWIWKQSDEPAEYQNGNWVFPESDWNRETRIEGNVTYTIYTHRTNGSVFRAFEKEDSQLNETYTVVTSERLNPGLFDLQTNKGKIIHVNVTQGSGSGKPETVSGVQGLTVNLFDYDVPSTYGSYDFTRSGNLDVQSNVASNPNNNNNINTNHDLKFLGYGGSNVSDSDIWFWINNYTKDIPQQGIVKDTLVNGYPELTPGRNGQERGNPGLGYLFDPNARSSNVYAFPNADGLFQKDNLGYYYYNSNSNYAEYDQDSNQFILYEHTYSQNTGGSNGSNAKPIGFFPFHEYDTDDIQPEMNFNQNLNHHFGMSMTVDFELPSGKQTADSDGNMHDIIYEFSGDDDLWVFIDDELVLDIGGIHQPVTGTINFTTGQIKVHGVDDITKTFDVGGHTLKMFYIERGGCDSNLSVRFNLPLTKGNGRLRVLKKSRTDDAAAPDQLLPKAVFGIWENASCTGEPYKTAISDGNGQVDFGNLPIKEDGQTYYLKEIVPPEGYRVNTTVYTVTANGRDEEGNFRFIVKQGDTEIEKSGNEPVIRDDRPAPINLGVKKLWENADGTDMNPPEKKAVFELKRFKTEVKYDIATQCELNVYRVDRNWQNPHREVTKIYAGNSTASVNWTYNQYYGYPKLMYRINNGSVQTKSETSPAQIALPSNGVVDVYIYDGNLGTQYEPYGVENITVTGTEGSSQADMEIGEKVIDPEFSETLTLPTTAGAWEDSFANLPLQETVNNSTFYYEYFIEEKTVPEGFEAVYLDKNGKPVSDPSGLRTSESGVQTIINRKLLDVPVEKQWADFSGESYTWMVKFQLEQMEVKVNPADPDAPDAADDFTPVEGKILEAEKGQTPVPQFTGLPMYRVHSNGTVYRIQYSVDEIAYQVKKNGEIVAQWSKDGTWETIGETKFEPQFVQDAGEHGADITDYVVKIVNVMEHRILNREISLSLTKTWPPGTDISDSDDAYATFVLRRYHHEEYRDYSKVSPDAEWVTITLRTSVNDDTPQEVIVPKGTTVHILGNIKPNTNANKIAFSQSIGNPIELIQNNPNPNQMPFDIGVTADQSKTLNLTQGDNYVVGGRDGFRLAAYNNRTQDSPDDQFEVVFTLSKANNWNAVFDYLPVIEEQDTDPKTNSQTIYVFSYYLEETESSPAGFSPVFTDSNGLMIGGDSANRIENSTALTASNNYIEMDLDVLKVEKGQETTTRLAGAAFELRKLEDVAPSSSGELTYVRDDQQKVIVTGKTTGPDGTLTFEKLTRGVYEIRETSSPRGYILEENVIFYLRNDGRTIHYVQKEQGKKPSEWQDAPNTEEGATVHFIPKRDGDTGNNTFRVGNVPGAVLPKTGGIGTGIFRTLGFTLIAGAGYLMCRRRYDR